VLASESPERDQALRPDALSRDWSRSTAKLHTEQPRERHGQPPGPAAGIAVGQPPDRDFGPGPLPDGGAHDAEARRLDRRRRDHVARRAEREVLGLELDSSHTSNNDVVKNDRTIVLDDGKALVRRSLLYLGCLLDADHRPHDTPFFSAIRDLFNLLLANRAIWNRVIGIEEHKVFASLSLGRREHQTVEASLTREGRDELCRKVFFSFVAAAYRSRKRTSDLVSNLISRRYLKASMWRALLSWSTGT
jgi:hypothetical protein